MAPVRKEAASSETEEGGEEVDEEMESERAVVVVEVLDWRLRKGREGTR